MTEGLANPNLHMAALFSHDIIVLYFECKILINENRLKAVISLVSDKICNLRTTLKMSSLF